MYLLVFFLRIGNMYLTFNGLLHQFLTRIVIKIIVLKNFNDLSTNKRLCLL